MSLAEYYRLCDSMDDWFCCQRVLPTFSDSFFASDSMNELEDSFNCIILPLAADVLLTQPRNLWIFYHNVQGLLSVAWNGVASSNIFLF